MKKVIMAMTTIALMASCAQQAEKVPAIDPTDMDLEVNPGDDFYRYSSGGWIRKNPLKAEYARYGAFDVLRERNEVRINELFGSMAGMKTKPGSVEQKIVDLYKQGLDSVRLNEEGGKPLQKYIDEIYAITSKEELVALIGNYQRSGSTPFFGCGVEADLADANMQVLYMGQGGLGIGDRDYYLEKSNAAIKEGYRQFIEKIFTLSGIQNPKQASRNCLKVEDALAAISWSKVQNRDYTKVYNPMSSAQIAEAFPGFDWAGCFEAAGVAPQEKIIVMQPSFFKGFAELFAGEDLEVLKDYVAAEFIQSACGSLSDDYYTASFDFFSRQLSGIQEQKPRWKRAMSVPNGILGEAVGQMYVKKYFPESYKKRVQTLVANLQTALGQRIDALDWMSDTTKAYAQQKLSAFTVKIGYPDKWKDYSSLNVDPSLSYFENLRAASRWFAEDNLSKLGKPTDRSEWGMTPQTVNAYYNPTTNEICFPAAILQPPFFNPDADDAVNYGAIGVVIGHEMTHGFDDQGRMFDKDGNMNNWWAPEDDAAFRAKADVLAAQFDEVDVVPGVKANGRLTLGENIADQGGLSIAFTALQNSWNGKHPAPIDGLSAEQRFYIGYGHVWATNCTDEEKARLTKLDVHSLAENRVNVSLRNIPTFFEAFGIKEGDRMFRSEEDQVHIW